MKFEVINRNNFTILCVTDLKDMFSAEDIQIFDTQGYRFKLNGDPVSASEAYNAVVAAYFREAQTAMNGR